MANRFSQYVKPPAEPPANRFAKYAAETPPATGPADTLLDKVNAVIGGIADAGTLGFSDEIAGGFGGVMDTIKGGSFSEGYERTRDKARAAAEADAEKRPGYRLGGQVVGSLGGGAALARIGLSLGANAARAGQGLLRTAMGSAADGAILGGLHGTGSGEDLGGRIEGAAIGSALGAGAGLAAPYATAGAATVAKPLLSPIMARLRPDSYANAALGEGVRRSNATPNAVAAALLNAQRDGQGVYTVADALGHSGQRMLSTVARNPHNERQAVADALMGRQAGQGRRITNALSEGFAAPDTAAQRVAALTAARDGAADISYGAARQGARPVDVSGALARIDEVLTPGVMPVANPGSTLANDSIEGALARVRGLLGNGRERLTDFTAVLRAKQEIDDMIGQAVRSGAGNKARLLTGVRRELDAALGVASGPYAGARDAFRTGSREIDAVDAGRTAATRGRPEDTIPAFQAMPPGEQAAFRSGYSDPLIEQAQSAAVGVNKARPLINDATAVEFPAFAAPGRGSQLGQRIAREQRMFETNQTALGGSRTADNLADAADVSRFDPNVMANLLRGRPIQAVIDAVTKAANNARGMPPTVLERMARVLMETRPDAARRMLQDATQRTATNTGRRAMISAILTNLSATGAGRLSAP